MSWREEYQSKYIKLEVGYSITGIFKDMKEGSFKGKKTYSPIIQTDKGDKYLQGHRDLLSKLTSIEFGKKIKVSCDKIVKNQYGKDIKIYKVEVIND